MCKAVLPDGRGAKAAPKAAHAEDKKTSIIENMPNTNEASKQTSFLFLDEQKSTAELKSLQGKGRVCVRGDIRVVELKKTTKF